MKEAQPHTARTSSEPCGVLVVDKPAGMTSHDVVAAVRRRFGIRRVGHTGTLDPMATGVLVLAVGPATRLIEYLPHEPKVYEAEIRLGVETDTQDITGTVIDSRDASGITYAEVQGALTGFRGPIQQVPPMVSALKVGGVRLYDLARRGATVERKPRPVVIHDLTVLGFVPGAVATLNLRVTCSSGTYIRTLAHDLGRALGVGGALAALRRTRVGPFTIDSAEPLDDCSRMLPLKTVLSDWPLAVAGDEALHAILHGQSVPVGHVTWLRPWSAGSPALLEDSAGRVVAVASVCGGALTPRKVLVQPEASVAEGPA